MRSDIKTIKKTVGLIIITNTGKAVLQTRGDFNIEKNKKETYAGASQLTVHGSIEENESEIDALLRETREELGEEFANLVQGKALDLIELNKVENKNDIVMFPDDIDAVKLAFEKFF